MRVAFGDHNPKSLAELKNIIEKYFLFKKIEAEIDLYTEAEELIEATRKKSYDIIFLNIVYGKYKGVDISEMDIAREIRRFDPFIPLVFINRIDGNTVESVFVKPKRYVNNPFNKDELFPMLDEISSELLSYPTRTVYIKTIGGNGLVIPVNDIIYADVAGHKISIHLHNGEILHTLGPMKNFAQNLSANPEFIIPHRSYIVNAIFISHITCDSVYIKFSDVPIPIAKGKATHVKTEYQNFFSKFQVLPYPDPWRKAQIDF